MQLVCCSSAMGPSGLVVRSSNWQSEVLGFEFSIGLISFSLAEAAEDVRSRGAGCRRQRHRGT